MVPVSKNTSTTATSGADTSVVLATPYRGALTRLVVKQTSGTLAGFVVNLYDCDPDSPPNSEDADVHKIIEAKTVATTESTTATYDLVVPYVNKEVDSTGALRPKSRLYLVITPSGTGDKDFEIGYTTTSDV